MKKRDPDIRAIQGACKALNLSSSRRMLKANLRFLLDRYLLRPSPYIPTRLKV